MAFSPEWPKGGLPMSCAKQAALTIVPISSNKVPFSSGCILLNSWTTSFPNDMPTHATSKLWVSRLCTNTEPGSGNTCVLFCNLRKGAEKISRS